MPGGTVGLTVSGPGPQAPPHPKSGTGTGPQGGKGVDHTDDGGTESEDTDGGEPSADTDCRGLPGLDLGGPLQSDLAQTGVVSAALDAREITGLFG